MTTAAGKEKTGTDGTRKNVDKLRDSALDLTSETSNLFTAFIEANAELQKSAIKALADLFDNVRDTMTSAKEDTDDTKSSKSGGGGLGNTVSDTVASYNRTMSNLSKNVADFVQDTAKGLQKSAGKFSDAAEDSPASTAK